MSTRANIVFKDGKEKLYFYRHSDGYPECCGQDLEKFVDQVLAYEPTTGLHGDVEFIYIIDLSKRVLETRVPTGEYWDKPTLSNTVVKSKLEF